MAGETQGDVWPLPKFYFSVQFGDDKSISFQEVSGLESETKVIEYRHGNSPSFYPIKMPGLGRVGNVTMKKGIFVNDAKFWAWYSEIKMNTIKRRTVVINLLDESGAPKMVWTLNNAWPTKVSGTDLKSEGNEVAVESIELAFETLVIAAT
jgi:phage tail-like protein